MRNFSSFHFSFLPEKEESIRRTRVSFITVHGWPRAHLHLPLFRRTEADARTTLTLGSRNAFLLLSLISRWRGVNLDGVSQSRASAISVAKRILKRPQNGGAAAPQGKTKAQTTPIGSRFSSERDSLPTRPTWRKYRPAVTCKTRSPKVTEGRRRTVIAAAACEASESEAGNCSNGMFWPR